MLQQWKKLSVTLGAVMCGALLTGVVMSWPHQLNQDARAQVRPALSAEAEENVKHAEGLSAAFRNVSESLRPSVVSISVEATPRLARGQGSLPPELRRQLPPWLGDDFFRQFEQQQGAPQPRAGGMGSGVVIRADGYLLTNNHVVDGAETLKVLFSDGRKLDAKVIGTDPETDLAVLKVEATGLQAAVLGDSESAQVGDWVVAIGSPFGLDQTVTAGIISGKNRVQGIVGDGNGFEDFLQTDAAINPGNSGGPLVNLRGEVIGINTAILSRTGANAGIGFAIPMGLAQPVADSIIESGSVRRGFLGAQVGDITPEVKTQFDLKVDAGALISGVLDGQPAAEAGLQPGDVVTEMDGKPVTGGTQLRNYIASRKPGSSVKIKVSRNGSLLDMQVDLRERTDEALAMFEGGEGKSGDFIIGARLKPLTEEQARELNLQGPAIGLLVTEIEDDGLAAQAKLQVGDVIETAAGQPLKTVEQFRSILDEQKKADRGLQMVIRRGNVRVLLVLR